MKKAAITWVLVAVLEVAAVMNGAEENAADRAWARLTEPIDGMSLTPGSPYEAFKRYGRGTEAYWYWSARVRQQYRDRGIEFWERFPSDPRRLEWFVRTDEYAPFYWTDYRRGAQLKSTGGSHAAIIDQVALESWRRKAIAYRLAYLHSKEVSDDQRWEFRYRELQRRIFQMADDRLTANADLLATQVLDLAGIIPLDFQAIFLCRDYLDLAAGTPPDAAAFIAAMQQIPRKALMSYAKGRARALQLREKSVLPELMTYKWDVVPPPLEGKVILVDIWSVWCGGCVQELPRLNRLYAKYRALGFEVVGVCLTRDADNDKTKAEQILRGMDIEKSQCFLSRDETKQFAEKYGVCSFPVKWLLDRNGLMVAHGLHWGQLEEEIRKQLSLPPLTTRDDTTADASE